MSHRKRLETVLRRHASVKDCIVLARDAAPGNQSLTAYILADKEVFPSVSELRRHIQLMLPQVAVPAKFVVRKSFPTMADGRVDRAAFRSLAQSERSLTQAYVAPRTPNERLMANIWQETLDLEDVGVYDNFFELVRDSYLAMEVIKRVREVFKVALSVRALFADPTVAGMTAAVLQQKAKWTNSPDSTEGISTLNLQKKTATRTTPATKY